MISNVQIFGMEDSIKAAKYPMAIDVNLLNNELTKGIESLFLSKKGEGHDNALNGIIVQFDLEFTKQAWSEIQRYHFIDFVSSQSTIHRITKFDLDNIYIKYVDERIINIMKEKVEEYNKIKDVNSSIKKEAYLGIIYSNPVGMKLTARMTTNYRQLKTIYSQRKNHKLPEWREFCKWCESLPYSKWITS